MTAMTNTHDTTQLYSDLKLGIFGAGQLARMLALAAHSMGVCPIVFASSNDDPAIAVATEAVIGPPTDKTLLERFLANVDVVIFENEFLPIELLGEWSNDRPRLFAPTVATMLHLRDKANQKRLLQALNIPTASFDIFDSASSINEWWEKLTIRFRARFVIKWGMGGYDGKGVFAVKNTAIDRQAALVFCNTAIKAGRSLYAEDWIDYGCELTQVFSYSTRNEFVSYPMTVMESTNGVCSIIKGPHRLLGVSDDDEKLASRWALQITNSSGLIGTFAIEFFKTVDGKLLVNEIAPRVHNSGHYTLNAPLTNQFENHLRAVLGLPLGATHCAGAFAMVNLLGVCDKQGTIPLPALTKDVYIHWYGKSVMRPMRKMGHLNAYSDTGDISYLMGRLLECRKRWELSCQS